MAKRSPPYDYVYSWLVFRRLTSQEIAESVIPFTQCCLSDRLLGCRCFVACGGAGVLNRNLARGHLVVPSAAVRDEGTSYHYLPPARDAYPSPAALTAIETVLRRRNVEYILGKTWTTDAYFRETRTRMARRTAAGCLTVEMEAAAMFAVAEFRDVDLGQILYSGDNLDGDEWDHRAWQSNWGVREILVELAAEACLAIDAPPR